MIKVFKGKLVEKIQRTPSIESFRFLPEERVDFIPGQFLQVLFDENNLANKDLNKYLSFSSSPTKEYIEFTKRLSASEFSQKLKALEIGQELSFKAPLGQCVFKNDYKNILFLIGGIGITPVISIIEYIVEKKLSTKIELFYSNRSEEEIAFKKELDSWQNKCDLKTFYTLTDCQLKEKSCFYGVITQELIKQAISCIGERVFFVYGPTKMVDAMRVIAQNLGCPQDKIKTEIFAGY